MVMIDAIAITIGTIARNEAKTKISTSRAPTPPIRASIRTPGPSVSAPESATSASKPVSFTGAPATVASSSAARAASSASGFSPKTASGSGRG